MFFEDERMDYFDKYYTIGMESYNPITILYYKQIQCFDRIYNID